MSDLLFSFLLALRRIFAHSSISVLVSGELTEDLVLPWFEGHEDLIKSLLFSDFCTANLFGPLDPLMGGRVPLFFSQ